MNGDQISCLLSKCIAETDISFLGVYPANLLPNTDKYSKCCYVVNTDPSDKPGKHWLAFYQVPDRTECFDPYGLHPTMYNLTVPITHYNDVCVQSIDSDACGQYCILYLFFRTRSISLQRVVHLCPSDGKVKAFVTSLMLQYVRVPCIPSCSVLCAQCCSPKCLW